MAPLVLSIRVGAALLLAFWGCCCCSGGITEEESPFDLKEALRPLDRFDDKGGGGNGLLLGDGISQ